MPGWKICRLIDLLYKKHQEGQAAGFKCLSYKQSIVFKTNVMECLMNTSDTEAHC